MRTYLPYLPSAIATFGSFFTSIGLFLTWKILKANHDWNRRQAALDLIKIWNQHTVVHRKAVEELRPGLVDVDKQNDVVQITRADAHRIYKGDRGSEEYQLGLHLIELLNHFEVIASAYLNGVADREMIEQSFRPVLVRWAKILRDFVEEVKEQRGYEPWLPYSRLVSEWTSEPVPIRDSTDTLHAPALLHKHTT